MAKRRAHHADNSAANLNAAAAREAQEILILQGRGALDETEGRIREFVTRYPKHPFGPKAVAAQLFHTRRFDEAIVAFREALAVSPNDPSLHNGLGGALLAIGQSVSALEAVGRAVELAPHDEDLLCNHAAILGGLGRHEDALAACYSAVQANPESIPVFLAFVLQLILMRRLSQASQCMQQLALCEIDEPRADVVHAMLRQMICDWSERDRDREVIRRAIDTNDVGNLGSLMPLSFDGFNRADLLRHARSFAEANLVSTLARPPMVDAGGEMSNERLRIGYLSADICAHATAFLLAGVFEHHDRTRVEVYVYSIGQADESEHRQRIKMAATVFRDLQGRSSEEIASAIARDSIDVLVDLKGNTSDARQDVLAMRPAPLIVNWLGFPGTMGLRRLADYIIGDPVVTPLSHAADYAETLALMPHCYQPNDRKRTVGAVPTRAEAGLPENAIVFCNFNQAYKTTPAMFSLWCEVLSRVPGSVLWLLQEAPEIVANLRREAAARGVSDERLVFAPPLPLSAHLGRLALADLAFDTSPYSSHTTASDALWVGVPLVARMGETFASRVSASLLTAVGMTELIAESGAAWVDLAVRLATDDGWRGELKARLLMQRETCPLFDTPRFTRDLEALFAAIWEHHRAQRSEAVAIA